MSERLREQVEKETERATSYDRSMIPTSEVLEMIKRIGNAGAADYNHGFRAGRACASNDIEILTVAMQATHDALSDDNYTYGERCDIALELSRKSVAYSLSSQTRDTAT